MKLLVTGGAGYIGSVCAARLVETGNEVVVLDDLSTGHRDAVPDGARFVHGDVHDAAQHLDPSFDGVVHLAAKSLVGESVQRPELYWHNNVVGSLALLDAMRDHGVRRIVFSSSAATYGQPESSPINETAPAMPLNPYGMSKLAVDMMLTAEAAAHGLGAVSLRYFNVGGAYGRFGERHDPETHLLPNLFKVALGETAQAAVFGTDYPTRDGTCVRDYLHVLDLAAAHLLALPACEPGRHHILNLGTGDGSTVDEVLDAVRRVTGHEIPAERLPRRAGDPASLVASNDRAREVLGWSPALGLTDAVQDAWTFLQARQPPGT